MNGTRQLAYLALAGGIAAQGLRAQSYSIETIAGAPPARDGAPAAEVVLRSPSGMATDAAGNIYFAESGANRVRRITPAGIISTIAGTGSPGVRGDGGLATQAELLSPNAVALDGRGNLYIADGLLLKVRKVDLTSGIITAFAGSGSPNFAGEGGPAIQAGLTVAGLAADSAGNVYIADFFNNRIRKIAATGIITTIAGTPTPGDSGDNGPAAQANLSSPASLTIDRAGNLYFVDSDNNRIRRISPDGRITAFAGTRAFGNGGDGGPAVNATFAGLGDIYAGPDGAVVLVSGIVVRHINTQGIITTVAGSINTVGFTNDGAAAAGAPLGEPVSAALMPNGDVLIAEIGRIRRVANGVLGTVAGVLPREGTAARDTPLNFPTTVLGERTGGILFSDTFNNRVRRVLNGAVTTAVGNGLTRGPGVTVSDPAGIALEGDGTLILVERARNRVVRVGANGNLSPLAGSGRGAFSGDGGAASAAALNGPVGVAIDPAQNVFIADYDNYRVRRVSAEGIITTVAGNGTMRASGDNGPATAAGLDPYAVAVDGSGKLVIADRLNHRVRQVDLRSGVITTIAGAGTSGYSGDGGPAVSAQLFLPSGVAFDSAGNLYISDTSNSRIRRVTPGGIITSIAGNGSPEAQPETGAALLSGMTPYGLVVEPAGSILFADAFNDRLRRLTPIAVRAMTIAAGDGRSGTPGTRILLTTLVTGDGGIPLAGVPVTFAVTAGAGALAPSTAITSANGRATSEITLGETPGPVTVTANTTGVPPVRFSLTITPPVSGPQPRINPGGVVGAGLSTPPLRDLSAGAIATIFGQQFTPPGAPLRRVGAADLVNGAVPQVFAGVCVLVGTVRAPVFLVAETQVNFQIPRVDAGRADVRLVTGCGTQNETTSPAEPVNIVARSPEFFFFTFGAGGRNAIAAVDAVSGALLGAPGLIPGVTTVPGRPDQLITVFLTGLGDTDPPVTPGEIPQGIARTTGGLRITVGGLEVAADRVTYAGVTPFNPGLFQINFFLPAGAAEGDQPVVIAMGGASTPAGAYLTIAR
ncbi:MAG: hypothetical protein K2X35_18935 [Bryobacteraceae bacterium]|nr:hypothetical protein [Bryobacteraceae bacterium]